MRTERIDKVLAHHGFGSRKDVKKLIHDGQVLINGIICSMSDEQIDIENDILVVNDKQIDIRNHVYLMMNKCKDVVCSTKDGIHKTVLDILPQEYKISFLGGDMHPVGRLDIDTEGLLLLTTDGSLTHKLTSPKNHVSKTYYVKLRDAVNTEEQNIYSKAFLEGLDVKAEGNEAGFKSKQSELVWPSEDNCDLLKSDGVCATDVLITIYEGKYHQVKRMFATVGNEVTYLKRISIGNLKLDFGLKPGEIRELQKEELSLLI